MTEQKKHEREAQEGSIEAQSWTDPVLRKKLKEGRQRFYEEYQERERWARNDFTSGGSVDNDSESVLGYESEDEEEDVTLELDPERDLFGMTVDELDPERDL